MDDLRTLSGEDAIKIEGQIQERIEKGEFSDAAVLRFMQHNGHAGAGFTEEELTEFSVWMTITASQYELLEGIVMGEVKPFFDEDGCLDFQMTDEYRWNVLEDGGDPDDDIEDEEE